MENKRKLFIKRRENLITLIYNLLKKNTTRVGGAIYWALKVSFEIELLFVFKGQTIQLLLKKV